MLLASSIIVEEEKINYLKAPNVACFSDANAIGNIDIIFAVSVYKVAKVAELINNMYDCKYWREISSVIGLDLCLR